MPTDVSSSCSSFWLSPVMPCSSASTSSCERICWFIECWLSLDDEVGEVHGGHRQLGQALLLFLLLRLVVGGVGRLRLLDLVAHCACGLAAHLFGELGLAVAARQLGSGLVGQRHQHVV